MIDQQVVVPLSIAAFLKRRGALACWATLAGAMLAIACSGRTEAEGVLTTSSPDSRSVTPSGGGAGGPVDGDGGLYGPCIGHNDFTSGSCAGDAICGSMPDVGYTYCMPRVPCAAGMVPVLNIACVYACDDASDCYEHGLAKCAVTTLPNFTGGPAGWCTP